MIQTRRFPLILLTPLIALALALVFLALAVSPILADGPIGRQSIMQRPTQRSRFVLPLAQNHRRMPENPGSALRSRPIPHQTLPTRPQKLTLPTHALPFIEPSAPAKKTKPRLLCPGCPGDERTAAPLHSANQVTPRIDRPGPPHPPPIIDDGRWPRPEWPSVDLRQIGPSTITFPPPRDDFPEIPQPLVLRIKPKRR